MRNYRAGAVFKCFSTLVPVRWNAPRKLFQLSPPLVLCIVNRLNTSYVLSCLTRECASPAKLRSVISILIVLFKWEGRYYAWPPRPSLVNSITFDLIYFFVFISPLCAKMIHCYVFGFNIPNWKTVLVVWDKGKTRRKKRLIYYSVIYVANEKRVSVCCLCERKRERERQTQNQSARAPNYPKVRRDGTTALI